MNIKTKNGSFENLKSSNAFKMRTPNTRSYVFLIISIFLAVTALFWVTTFATQRTEISDKFEYKAEIQSFDNFYNSDLAQFTGETESATQFGYRVTSSEGDKLQVENFFYVKSLEGKRIFSVQRNYSIDAESGRHLKSKSNPDGTGYLFAPPNLDKKPFSYWHVESDKPIKMQFEETEELFGLRTYRYKGSIDLDQTQAFSFEGEVGTKLGVMENLNLTIWIVPSTGYLVKFQSQGVNSYVDLQTKQVIFPRNQFRNSYSQQSVLEQTKSAQNQIESFTINRTAIPFALIVLAMLFAYLAVYNFIKHNRRRSVISICFLIVEISIVSAFITVMDFSFVEKYTLSGLGSVFWIFVATIIGFGFFCSENKTIRTATTVSLTVSTLFTASLMFLALTRSQASLKNGSWIETIASNVRIDALLCYTLLSLSVLLLSAKSDSKALNNTVNFICFVNILISSFDLISHAFGKSNLISSVGFNATFISSLLIFLTSLALYLNNKSQSESDSTSSVSSAIWALGIFILLANVTGFVWQYNITIEKQDEFSNFKSTTDKIQGRLDAKLQNFGFAVEGTKGLFSSSDDVNRTEFKSYIDTLNINENYQGLQAIGYSELIPRDELIAHEMKIRNEGFPDYSVKPSEPIREMYSSIVFIEPFNERNQRAFGFDMYSEPTRRTAMNQARDSGITSMTDRVRLVQETEEDTQWGFLVYTPIYKNDMSISTVQDRQVAASGFSYAPIRMNDFMQSVLQSDSDLVNVTVYNADSIGDISKSNILYGSHKTNNDVDLQSNESLFYGGQTWQILYSSNESQSLKAAVSIADYILFLGLALSFAVSFASYLLISSRQRTIRYANKVTKDLQRERNLAIANQQKDEAILAGVAEGLIVYDQEGRILRINKSALELLGYDESETVGHLYYEVFNKYTMDGKKIEAENRPVAIVLRTGQVLSDLMMYEKADKSLLPARVTAAALKIDHETVGVVEIFTDMTLETEVDRNKSEFVSLAAHQLKTPIGAIEWEVQMLLNGNYGELNKEQENVLNQMSHMNVRMNELVSGFLNVSRIESGSFEVSPVEINIEELVEEIVSEMKIRYAQKPMKILNSTRNTFFLADESLLRILFHNLLNNAIKYSPPSSQITISSKISKSEIEISISNFGPMIPLIDQPKIFEKLQRGGNAAEFETDGNGLGLYMCKKIIDSTGGRIWFESNQNGTTFSFSYPISGMESKQGRSRLTVPKI